MAMDMAAKTAARPVKPRISKGMTGARKKGKGKIGLVLLIVTLSLILCIGFIMVMNIGGIQTKVMTLLDLRRTSGTNILEQTEQEQLLKEYEKKLNQDKAALEKEKAELDNRYRQVRIKEQELASREEEIRDLEEQLKALRDELSIQADNRNGIIKVYENMDAQSGANVLTELMAKDDELVVSILKGMKKEKAAEILGLMAPKKAAELVAKMAD